MGNKKIVAITARPASVAHTFTISEASTQKYQSLNLQIKVETGGSVDAKNQLTASKISDTDLVIIATDIDIDLPRFDGKKQYKTSNASALKRAFKRAITHLRKQQFTITKLITLMQNRKTTKQASIPLMTGVFHLRPVVVTRDLFIARSFVFGLGDSGGALTGALLCSLADN